MKNGNSSKSVILAAFLANLFIALVKFVVAIITRSSAMLAEAIHSLADTFNQVLLLIGIKRGQRQPDSLHPFGFSGELYFWSFIVAIILFTAGAVFSIYEGIHKLIHPAPIRKHRLRLRRITFFNRRRKHRFCKCLEKSQLGKGRR